MGSQVHDIFDSLGKTFESHESIREQIRSRRDEAKVNIDAAERSISSLLTEEDISKTVEGIKEKLSKCGPTILGIEDVLPKEPGTFYRFNDMWHNQLHSIVMISVICEFFTNDSLATIDQVKSLAGASFTLPPEAYLFGVCNAIGELPRICMNRVIHDDYLTPVRCSSFANNVFDAYKQLSFRNDALRKRFDTMKYDVKQIDEVLYDLTIRGLTKKKLVENTSNDTNPNASNNENMID